MNANYQPYPAYEESGVEWVGETPAGWKVLPFFVRASQCKRSNKGMVNDNLLSLSFGRVVRKNIGSSEGLLPESFETYQVVEPDDIVFRLTDLQNDKRSLRSAICRERGIITSAYLAAQPVGIEPSYLAFLMRSYDLTKVLYALGSGLRQSLKYSDMKRLPLLVPPLEEQTQIAKFLDYETAKIDALVEKQQQLIALLKEKRQAVISNAVTKGLNPDVPMRDSGVEWLGEVPAHWEVVNLNRVVRTFVDYRGRTPEKTDEGRPLVTAGAVRNGIVDLERALQFVSDETYNLLRQRGIPEVGDLLFTSEAPLGEVAIVEDVEIACAQRIIMFKLDRSRIQPRFMWLYLRSQAGQDEIQTKASGSTAEGIRADRLRRCRVLVPPPEEQAEIVSHVAKELSGFDEILEKASEQTELLQERRTALISAAVTGKIDVRGWKAPESEVEAEVA